MLQNYGLLQREGSEGRGSCPARPCFSTSPSRRLYSRALERHRQLVRPISSAFGVNVTLAITVSMSQMKSESPE